MKAKVLYKINKLLGTPNGTSRTVQREREKEGTETNKHRKYVCVRVRAYVSTKFKHFCPNQFNKRLEMNHTKTKTFSK